MRYSLSGHAHNLSTVSILRTDCAFWSQLRFAEHVLLNARLVCTPSDELVLEGGSSLSALVLNGRCPSLLLQAAAGTASCELLLARCTRVATHILSEWDSVHV